MSTAIQEARGRIETYVAECILGHLALDLIKLRSLEAELILAVRVERGLVF